MTTCRPSPRRGAPRRWRRSGRSAPSCGGLFGNPFRPAALDLAWLAWEGGTVAKLAQAIYDGRRFTKMPYLGDALEEAGCADAQILAHCRGPGPHVRGCWVLDLILGRE